MSEKFKFKPIDFEDLNGQGVSVMASEIANAKLEEWLKDSSWIYSFQDHEDPGQIQWVRKQYRYHDHRAKIICEEKIEPLGWKLL